ncbi:hypothetical protein EV424DRAFT_1341464 [Suillus variegatus]|nr:hypothetical protein EV424DRAFT_1341464 [Suillus variegatus]
MYGAMLLTHVKWRQRSDIHNELPLKSKHELIFWSRARRDIEASAKREYTAAGARSCAARTRALQSTLNLNYLSPRPFVSNLTFQFNDLGKEVIMLAWSPNLDSLYEDFFLMVWRVSKFGKSGPYWATETYTDQAQVESGKDISAATSVNINNSEKTTLTKANDVYHFSPLPRQCVRAYNYVAYSQAVRGVASG